eukprot:4878713-Amphidinium_carterae.1
MSTDLHNRQIPIVVDLIGKVTATDRCAEGIASVMHVGGTVCVNKGKTTPNEFQAWLITLIRI